MPDESFERLRALPLHLTRSLTRLGHPGHFPMVRRAELPWSELVAGPALEGWSARRLRADLRPVGIRQAEPLRAG